LVPGFQLRRRMVSLQFGNAPQCGAHYVIAELSDRRTSSVGKR
jgi:hypothetical protein